MKAQFESVRVRENTCPARETTSRSAVLKTLGAAAGREAMAATTELLGGRHIMFPAGTPWFG
jgi:hypothetical protein